MTCKGAPKAHVLSVVSLLITIFAILIALVAPAQESTKPSAASVPMQASTPGQTLFHALLPGDDSAERSAVARSHRDRFGADAMSPSAPFFLPPVIYDPHGFGFENVSVAIADVNGDGKPDLLVANRFACSSCANGSVAVLVGNGDGTFQSAVTYDSGAMQTETIAVVDVNGDGKPDIIVGNHCGCSGQIGVLLGNGDGTFQTAVGYFSIVGADKIVVRDVNGDGKPDVLALAFCAGGNCPHSDGAVTVLLGNGDGTFQVTGDIYDSGGRQAESIAVADVNGDGKPDLLVANQCTSQGCTQEFHGVVGVLLGNGEGTFQPVVNYSGGNHTSGVAVADVNGDGKLDVLETDVGNGAGVLLGNGNGTFQQRVGYDTGGYTSGSIAVADVNRDGKLDLLVANETSGTVAVLLGNGDGTFQPAVIQAESDPRSLAVAGLNGDGRVDLVVGTSDGNLTPLVGVMLNNTADTTPPVITLSTTPKVLWPPNGKMVPVTVSGTITDTGSGVNVNSAAYAVKDEYGEVQPQGAITLGPGGAYSFTILLQASRLGTDLDGRRYTVTVRAKDNAGNGGSKTSVVTVPHDQGRLNQSSTRAWVTPLLLPARISNWVASLELLVAQLSRASFHSQRVRALFAQAIRP